jgi:hypothetical protein
MKVVFTSTSAVIGQTLVIVGQHWPSDDPIVVDNPSLFSDDPRWGLTYSTEPSDLREPVEKRRPGRPAGTAA